MGSPDRPGSAPVEAKAYSLPRVAELASEIHFAGDPKIVRAATYYGETDRSAVSLLPVVDVVTRNTGNSRFVFSIMPKPGYRQTRYVMDEKGTVRQRTEEIFDDWMPITTRHEREAAAFERRMGSDILNNSQVLGALGRLQRVMGKKWPPEFEVPPGSDEDIPPSDQTKALFRQVTLRLSAGRATMTTSWNDGDKDFQLVSSERSDGKPGGVYLRETQRVLVDGAPLNVSRHWEFMQNKINAVRTTMDDTEYESFTAEDYVHGENAAPLDHVHTGVLGMLRRITPEDYPPHVRDGLDILEKRARMVRGPQEDTEQPDAGRETPQDTTPQRDDPTPEPGAFHINGPHSQPDKDRPSRNGGDVFMAGNGGTMHKDGDQQGEDDDRNDGKGDDRGR